MRISRLIAVTYLLCCGVLQAVTPIFYIKGLMHSADLSDLRHFVLSSLRCLLDFDLWPPNHQRCTLEDSFVWDLEI